ncbi:mRNA-decapping enzyme 1A [Labrus mixtus]|uniref:mRNA-decapping enzyme 1A n=1 Tax=Labrus mixtus TaxID=508554 RepID=UPI0029C068A1|nr:mRNA-decapping enzyme 1A [Labrus mixtus]
METVNAGNTMSLAALQRQDPYINKLLDVTGQVALYNFNSKANEWEKTEIEGTLFVYARSASPYHGFTIMNRLSTENLVEPINKDLEFQLQDPFLLYRNGNLGIYSIWFYDKRDCQRIAQLMVKIVKQEADLARRESPESNICVAEPRSLDILELLSKAKEEYQRAQEGETDVSAEQNVKAAINAPEQVPRKVQPEKSSHTMVKQITVEELFGLSLHKDLSSTTASVQPTTSASSDPSTSYLQNHSNSTPAHQNPLPNPHLPAPDARSNQQHQAPSLLPAQYAIHPNPVFPRVPLAACTTYMGKEILGTLKPAAPSVNIDIHKQIIAPNILPSALFPPNSFQEPIGKPLLQHVKKMDVFSQPSNLIKPLSTVPMSPDLACVGSEISVLLSPSAFQQSINKTTSVTSGVPPAPAEPSSSSVGVVEPPRAPCSKTLLQETLLHLIKNDADFLGAIHDAYLQTLTKNFSNMKV